MKRVLLIVALVLGSTVLFAQKYNKNEVKQLQSFLQQKSAKGDSNADRLEIVSINTPAAWKGVTWNNGRVVSIDWQDKDLAGDINLNGFSAMQKVNLSRNKITVVDATNCSALTDMNVSRNKLSELDLTGCIALVKLDCYKNRLTEIDLSTSPQLKNLNCSNNLFVEFNIQGSSA